MKNAASILTAVIVLLGASATATYGQSDPGARYARLALALDAATDGGYVFAYLGPAEDREEAASAGPREQMAGMFGFVDAFRTYVVTYSLGHDLVRDRVNAAGEHPTARWAAFRDLATALVTPELMRLEAERQH